MKYEYILFDADDTLLDFQDCEEHALHALLLYAGGKASDDEKTVYKKINAEWWRRFEHGEVTKTQLTVGRFADTCDALGLNCDPNDLSGYYIDRLGEGAKLMDGAMEICRALYGKCRMYIITNGIQKVQESRWNRTAIKDMFDGLFISEAIGYQKPRPEYFDYVFSAIGNPPKDRVLIVGDSLTSDIAGGIAAGTDTCWVNPTGKSAGNLSPTYIIKSLTECLDIIL